MEEALQDLYAFLLMGGLAIIAGMMVGGVLYTGYRSFTYYTGIDRSLDRRLDRY